MSTNYINQITDTAGTTHDIMEGVDTRIFRATCSTAAATAAKVATLEDDTGFSLTAGVRVAVTFTYGNSATTPTLRVDGSSTGTAASIAYPSSATAYGTGNGTTYNTWGAYETMLFTYTGTYWVHLPSGYLGYLAYYKANSNHTHGNITAGGDITAAAPTIATGDQLIMNDESASKIVNSGLTFDTTVTDAYLRRDGTWATTSSTSALTIESSPTSSSSNLVTSGGIYNAINNKVNRTTAVNAADTNYTTIMARGIKLIDSATYAGVSNWSSELVNGSIAFAYE